MRCVALVGNPKPESSTLAVAAAATAAVIDAAELTSGYQVIDLCGLARRLLLPEPSAAIEYAIEQITRAPALVR